MTSLKVSKYAVKDDNGVGIVFKNGEPTMCPFQNKLAVPQQSNIQGGMAMAINQYPCMTICPHCNITGENVLEISCTGIVLTHVMEEYEDVKPVPTPKASGGKILSLS